MDRQVRRTTRRRWAAVAGLLLLVVAVAVLWRAREAHGPETVATVADVFPVARRETKPMLDPALFSGKARLAYEVAAAIPNTLDQLTCYCGCVQSFGHKSLLSCYTDEHGST